MFNQNRIYRALKAITLLRTMPSKSVQLLARQLETTPRTVYRYLELIEALGFVIEKDANNRYYIINPDAVLEPLFSKEEAQLVKEVVALYAKDHPLKEAVLQKVAGNENTGAMSTVLHKAHFGKMVTQLQEAITAKTQVVLKNYHSVHSNTVADRIVEPFQLVNDFQYVCCYDTQALQNKFFAVERIAAIQNLITPFRYSAQHVLEPLDVFGFSNQGVTYAYILRLQLRAYVLLKEEYPKTIPFLQKEKNGNTYLLTVTVNNNKPLERFINGLPNDIEVLEKKTKPNYF